LTGRPWLLGCPYPHLLRGKPKEAAMSLTPPSPAAARRIDAGLYVAGTAASEGINPIGMAAAAVGSVHWLCLVTVLK